MLDVAKTVQCTKCGEPISAGRAGIGYTTCLSCGEQDAKQARMGWCISIPYSKGAYQLITDPTDLKTSNPKRTHQ